MRTTQQMSITLPLDMAELVRAKVQSGEYASESEVIRDGLRSLSARDRAVENWLTREVASAYDELEKEPGRARDANQVRARMRAEHQKLA
jgi:antitoxin ParD1/3/4